MTTVSLQVLTYTHIDFDVRVPTPNLPVKHIRPDPAGQLTHTIPSRTCNIVTPRTFAEIYGIWTATVRQRVQSVQSPIL